MNTPPILDRAELTKALGGNTRLARAFEQTNLAVSDTQDAAASNAAATDALADATVLTLSPNASFNNERVLKHGPGITTKDDGQTLTIDVSDAVAHVEGDFTLRLVVSGDTLVAVPLVGRLATTDQAETLQYKTLDAPLFTGIIERATDAAASVGEVYTLPGSTALHYRRS